MFREVTASKDKSKQTHHVRTLRAVSQRLCFLIVLLLAHISVTLNNAEMRLPL